MMTMSAESASTAIVAVAPPPTVQIVPKASSDQLLSKFADTDDHSDSTKKKKNRKMKNMNTAYLAAARKRSRRESGEGVETGRFLERKSLLPPANEARKSSSVMRKLGIGRSSRQLRGKGTKTILGNIRKTWRTTVEGASRVFMEKHYNSHKRLINDPL